MLTCLSDNKVWCAPSCTVIHRAMPVCCWCNSSAHCKNCSCTKSGHQCVNCLPGQNGQCSNHNILTIQPPGPSQMKNLCREEANQSNRVQTSASVDLRVQPSCSSSESRDNTSILHGVYVSHEDVNTAEIPGETSNESLAYTNNWLPSYPLVSSPCFKWGNILDVAFKLALLVHTMK